MPFFIANWRIIAVAIVFAIYSAFIYRIGSAPYRAELAALRAAGNAQNVATAKTDVQTKEVFTHANQTAATAFAAIDDHWLHKQPDSGTLPFPAAATGGIEPAPTPSVPDTAHCTDRDSAHDAEQVVLLQTYYEQQRALINGQ